jgi:hypothetical protein
MAAPNCTTQSGMSAVDLSQPVTTITTKSGKSGTAALKSIGVKTIARYYDWIGPDTTCKSLFPSESNAIIGAGFSIMTIFQHENSNPETFIDPDRGGKDANEAIKLAAANGQPPGSAIYFAVDGVDQVMKDSVFEYSLHKGKAVPASRRKKLLRADPSFRKHLAFYERFRHYHRNVFNKSAESIRPTDMLPFVDHYFREVDRVLKADGRYRVGGYGSGLVCKHLLANKRVDFCWLAMSTGWPGSKELARFDFNRIKPGDVGQWSKKGPVTPATGLPSVCKPSW